jgi:hypothetical protein
MAERRSDVNLFFRLAALSGAAFVVTIFALVAIVFSESNSPAAYYLNEHGGRMIAGEVAAILVCGLLAMAVDRRQIVRELREQEGAFGSGREDPAQPPERPDDAPA